MNSAALVLLAVVVNGASAVESRTVVRSLTPSMVPLPSVGYRWPSLGFESLLPLAGALADGGYMGLECVPPGYITSV